MFGNVMLGPTAEDVDDKTATGSTADGIAACSSRAGASCPQLARRGGHGGLRRPARRHRARRLPDRAPPRAALRLRRRHPLDRADGVDGDRRVGHPTAGRGRAGAASRGTPTSCSPSHAQPRRGLPPSLPGRRPDRLPLRARDGGEVRDACAGADPRRSTSTACAAAPARSSAAARASTARPPSAVSASVRHRPLASAARRARQRDRRRRRRRRSGRPGAAIALRRLGVGRVVVLEREQEPGGVPRHTEHTGFGLRDLHRLLDGPAYARASIDRAAARRRRAPARHHRPLGWSGGPNRRRCRSRPPRSHRKRPAPSSSPPAAASGRAARASSPATGRSASSRPARSSSWRRPSPRPVGRRAVVVGAEHVSFSAVLTLAHAGARTVAMVTEHPRHQTYAPLRVAHRRPPPRARPDRCRASARIVGRGASRRSS